ncbi:MAG: hypothetical protein HY738_14210 [Bacteroidia bacterium]|nr:hypothetical protein [Bacteroidia bacterium]
MNSTIMFFARPLILLLLLSIISPVKPQNDTIKGKLCPNDEITCLRVGSGLNLMKTRGINIGIDYIYSKKYITGFCGIEFFGTDYIKLEQVDFSDYLQKRYAFNCGAGARITYKKFELLNLIGGFIGYERFKQASNNYSDYYTYSNNSPFGLKYEGILNYKLSDAIEIGFVLSYSYSKKTSYISSQLSLLYNIDNKKSKGEKPKKDSNHQAKNSVFFELLGNGIIYSLNYDRIVLQKNGLKTSARFGIAIIPFGDINHLYITEINQLIGCGNSYFEIGLGITQLYVFSKEGTSFFGLDDYDYFGFIRIGYRHQKPKGGLFYRIGITPFMFLEESYNKLYPYFGFSIGKSF